MRGGALEAWNWKEAERAFAGFSDRDHHSTRVGTASHAAKGTWMLGSWRAKHISHR
jgi:hypothetical protein